ncbi:alpha/beta hydrolase [Pseudomonas fragi]|jgi:alpha-beta hydrolase superfamily lysophospholipase|uniref:Alpha/beta hydrolase n=1 Tax=Pseudomonas fragi TaxID=296 RepID=A0A9Q5FR70_PSEFR|nr:alpha/beta hydrolase [Pseudomonas fragi]MBM1199915.1 alpha/beta hydrolase [Pseudomonas fragi]NNB23353.1 alpha/beta hydrolase [Pseudomonas fragi]NNB32932.1 alpha/beta hydrolase [Pseudomonas fragi]NNB50843.1 alpha/beta hydrolase [Pseudomonas fragi]PAA10899.1 alpha/beta hydrolase [Pseudomonas fragi]
MPAPFSPDSLRANLQPLAAGQPLSSEALAYQRFYGLDFPHRTPAPKRQLGCFSAGGYQLVSQVWWPDSPPVATLFVIHGFYDHMGLYRHVIEWGLNRGFVVIACDLPGHGLSSGERASIDDFAQYQAVLQGLFIEAQSLQLPQPWHLCGQSTGGAIVLDHLLRYGEQSPAQGKAILLSPLVRPKDWGWSKLSYYLLRPFVKGIARRFSENSNDPAFLPFLQADPLQPLRLPTAWVGALARWIPRIENASPSARQPLVVQGQADKTVDWQHNLEVLKTRFNQPRVLLLPEARHHLANETAAIREQYFGFLDQYL